MVYTQGNSLPEAEFVASSKGITVYSTRLSSPRFLPFDNPGKCLNCRSEGVEVDFIVMSQGILIYCSRIKCPRFLPFDCVYALPNHCFFKLRTKGRIINIPYENTKPTNKQAKKEEGTVQQFFDSLTAATTFVDHPSSQNKSEGTAEQFFDSLSAATHLLPTQEKILPPMNNSDEFFDSLFAATTYMDHPLAPDTFEQKPKGNVEQLYDYLSAVTHLLPSGEKLSTEAGPEQFLNSLSAATTYIDPQMLNNKDSSDAGNVQEEAHLPQQFFDSLSAATSTLVQPPVKMSKNKQVNEEGGNPQEFMDSLNAATTMLEQPSQPAKKQTVIIKRRR